MLSYGNSYCPCKDEERFKYLCLGCRRAFKPAIRAENRYWDDLVVPRDEYCPRHKDERRHFPKGKAGLKDPDEARWVELHERADVSAYFASLSMSGPGLFSDDEIAQLSEHDHFMCWRRLHPIRCPGCGEPGRRVGGSFEPPPRRKAKAWKQLKTMLENGGRFDHCSDSVREGLCERKLHQERWSAWGRSNPGYEKKKRIEVLRKAVELGVRTSEEERRLNIIRGRLHGQESPGESWIVVTLADESE